MTISRGILRQYVAAIAASLGTLNASTCFMWMTPLLDHLKGPHSEIPMTNSDLTWVIPIIELGNLIIPLPAAWLINILGRKWLLFSSGPIFISSWILILYWPSVIVLGVSRVMQGIAMGIVETAGPIYLGEIASDSARGAITSLFCNSWWVGGLLSYSLGAYLSYTTFTILTMCFNLPFMLMFFWQHESPYFYISTGQTEEAYKALSYFRDIPADQLKVEIENIRHSIESDSKKSSSFRDLLSTPWDRKAFVLLMVLSVARLSTGTGGITVYATEIFDQIENSIVSPDNTTIILGVVMLVGSLVSSFTSDSIGRRPLLLLSTVGSLFCQLVIGSCFYCKVQISWLVPLFILAYSALCTAGMYPVCTAYTTELFSSKTRGMASSFSALVVSITSFVVMVIFEPLNDSVGLYANFYLYAFNCLVAALFVYFMAPETKGKSFGQIRNDLQGGSKTFDSSLT